MIDWVYLAGESLLMNGDRKSVSHLTGSNAHGPRIDLQFGQRAALPGWLLLVLAPWWRVATQLIAPFVIPLLLALALCVPDGNRAGPG